MFPMRAKILVVVIELISQNLDEYRNNGVIYKLTELLSEQI